MSAVEHLIEGWQEHHGLAAQSRECHRHPASARPEPALPGKAGSAPSYCFMKQEVLAKEAGLGQFPARPLGRASPHLDKKAFREGPQEQGDRMTPTNQALTATGVGAALAGLLGSIVARGRGTRLHRP